ADTRRHLLHPGAVARARASPPGRLLALLPRRDDLARRLCADGNARGRHTVGRRGRLGERPLARLDAGLSKAGSRTVAEPHRLHQALGSASSEHVGREIVRVCHYREKPGTWVVAYPKPAWRAANGNNRSSAWRMVPSMGTGSIG